MNTVPDIFFELAYQDLFKDTAFGGEPICFTGYGDIEYRFYRRPIEETEWYDIVSPYGYTGPTNERGSPWFNWPSGLFAVHMSKLHVVAEFARLHPFTENHLPLGEGVRHSGTIVYVDLTQDDIQKGFDKGCRSAITQAKRNLTVRWGWDNLEAFKRNYETTMVHSHAGSNYFFPKEFFDKLCNLPGAELCCVVDDQVRAGAVFLTHGIYCHYFLSGYDWEHKSPGANNLLLSEAIAWAKNRGHKIFNLGGGVKPNDNLFHFKKSFSKLTKPFFTYRKVHNQEVYDWLCKKKGVKPTTDGYFPAYRSPV